MSGFGSAYKGARKRIGELASGLPEKRLSEHVPACPEWSVKDLVAHVAGIASDMLQGDVADAGKPEWTKAQIAARRKRSIGEILAEWDETGPQVEAALEYLHPAAAGAAVGDVVTHEHDLRGAISQPGARDSDGVAVALDSYVRWLGRRIRDRGLPTLEVRAPERSWHAGKETPAGYVAGPQFELLRALTGRRTKDQIRHLEWSVDPSPYLDVFSSYDLPDEEPNE